MRAWCLTSLAQIINLPSAQFELFYASLIITESLVVLATQNSTSTHTAAPQTNCIAIYMLFGSLQARMQMWQMQSDLLICLLSMFCRQVRWQKCRSFDCLHAICICRKCNDPKHTSLKHPRHLSKPIKWQDQFMCAYCASASITGKAYREWIVSSTARFVSIDSIPFNFAPPCT